MGIFGRKEEEFDEEDGFSEEEQLRDRKLTRKFRDLSPENRKNRKEPPRPWGKKERLIILGFFLITTIFAAVMFLFSHDFKFPGLPRIAIGSLNFRNPFGEEIIEIGQKSDAPKNDKKADAAITLFSSDIKPLSGFYGFLVIRLNDGAKYGVSSNGTFQGASLLKLPLMTFVYKLAEDGNLNLDTEYILKNADKIKGSGVLYTANPGTRYTYRQLVKFMGKNSDRTAYKIIKDIVGDGKFKNYVAQIGMKNTDLDLGITTPDDIGILFYKLWNGNLVNQVNRDEILDFLKNTVYERWITAGVPQTVSVAHKFGQDSGVMADAGIVFGKNPYILVVMGNGITQNDADLLFPKVSKDIYNVENNIR